ncbi:hypothetical protein DFH28DRAFT_971233 [Melampsora americana]|nr:hypothetical protein DFH28DRAFT_971233 [Melampsora americana]
MSPMKPRQPHRLLKTDQGQEPAKQSSSSHSVFLRCPRPPCVASYLPFNAAHHSRSCKHFSCPNAHCGFVGSEAQVQYHLSECLYSLPFSSDQAATTDPLSSDMDSEVQDILTSPHKNSYPTDPSSDPSSSPRDSKEHLKLAPLLFSRPSSASSQPSQIPPLSSCLPQKRRYLSTLAPTRTLAVNPIVNPYDPAAKRIFSRPPNNASSSSSSAPKPSTSQSSSPMPRSPAPKSSTVCLARYRPSSPQESALASQAEEILKLQAALAKSQSDVTRLRDHLTNVKDELGNLADAAYCDFPHDKLVNKVIKTYETTCNPLLAVLEETAGVVGIKSNQEEEEEEIQNEAEFAAEEKDGLQDDMEEEEEMYSTSEDEESEADEEEYCSSDDDPLQPISSSNTKPSSSKRSADSSLTASELSALVRRRISGSRPRTRDDDMFGKDDSQNSCRRPTAFVRRLAETTWDPSDDVEEAGVPGVCNLMKLFEAAKRKKRQREDAGSL